MAVAESQVRDAIVNNDHLSEKLEDGEIVEREADIVRNLIQQKHREINHLKQVHFFKCQQMYKALQRHERDYNDNRAAVNGVLDSTQQLESELASKATREETRLIQELEDQCTKIAQYTLTRNHLLNKANGLKQFIEQDNNHSEELAELNQILADKEAEIVALKKDLKMLKSRKKTDAGKPAQQQEDGATEEKRLRLEN